MKRNFAFSWVWFGIAGLLAGLFVGAYFYIERLLEQRRDKVFMRGRRANKVVHARLRAASEYLKAGRDRRFYDEVLRALWGYMGDKLNIPAANLTKENIREELLRKGVPTDIIVGYTGLITECESAQYSPTESAPAAEIYRKTADAIAKIEGCFR